MFYSIICSLSFIQVFLIITCLLNYLCSDHILNTQDVSKHSFHEVGAAALLVGDMEAKMKGELWRSFGAVDMPYFDKLLQTSLLTTVTNSASARAHMKAITASKRSKTGSLQIWHVLSTQPAALMIYNVIVKYNSFPSNLISILILLYYQQVSNLEVTNMSKMT